MLCWRTLKHCSDSSVGIVRTYAKFPSLPQAPSEPLTHGFMWVAAEISLGNAEAKKKKRETQKQALKQGLQIFALPGLLPAQQHSQASLLPPMSDCLRQR